jgi:outer membrane autotransporter protein
VAGVGSVTFAATGGVPSGSVLEIVSGGGQSLVPMEDSDPLRVRVRTAAGVAVVGAVVSFAADRAEAVLVPGEATTDSDGIASSIVRIGIPVGVRVIARLRDAPSVAAVEFTLNAGVVNTAGLSPRQIDAAHAIDMACPQLAALDHPTPQQQDLLARCTELVANAEDDPGDVGNALGEMLADDAKAQNTAALNAASRQIDNLKARFAALRGGARGVDVAGLNVLVPGGSLSLGLLPSAIVLAAGEPPQEVGADFARWGFFATGTVGRGKRDADSLDPGFEYDSYDITAGVDYRVTDSWILGAALGFNRNETDHQDDLGGMDSKGWTLSGYASWFDASAWYADAVLSFGRNDFDLTRRVEYDIDAIGGGRTRVDQIATASPGGDRRAFSIALGRDFNHGAWSFGPYLRATYSKLDFDGYTEAMSNPTAPGGGLALAVSARELKSLEAVLGARLGYALSTSWGVLLPSAQVEWAREFEDDPALLATRFAHDPTGTPILVAGERIDNDYFNLGVGLSGVFANGRSAYLQYERVAGQERMSSDSLAIGVRIEF